MKKSFKEYIFVLAFIILAGLLAQHFINPFVEKLPLLKSTNNTIIDPTPTIIRKETDIRDNDFDYLANFKEYELGLDPDNSHTYGEIQDFIRWKYWQAGYLNLNDADRDDAFLRQVKEHPDTINSPEYLPSNGGAKYYEVYGAEFEKNYDFIGMLPHMYNLSKEDPVMESLVKKTEIILPQKENSGSFLVDGKPPFESYGAGFANPAGYFTNGKQGGCTHVSSSIVILLKMKGENAKMVCNTDVNDGETGHCWVELEKDGKKYVVNYNEFVPADIWYKNNPKYANRTTQYQ